MVGHTRIGDKSHPLCCSAAYHSYKTLLACPLSHGHSKELELFLTTLEKKHMF